LTLILSIDRLYAIKNPTKIKSFFTNLHSKILLISSYISLLIVKIPGIFFCYENTTKNFHLIYCTLISPAVLNVIPTVIIFIINSLLIYEIVSYYRMRGKLSKDSEKTKYNLKVCRNSSMYVRCVNYKPVDRVKRSHYLVIIILAAWSVFTSIPYYAFHAFYLLITLNIFTSTDTKALHVVQITSSIFFNSNHCINFFIYLFFYDEFRVTIFKTILCHCRVKNKLKEFTLSKVHH
jgi:hypothetical protein